MFPIKVGTYFYISNNFLFMTKFKLVLSSVAVVAIATFVVNNVRNSRADESDILLLQNVEVLSQDEAGSSDVWNCWSELDLGGGGVWRCGSPCVFEKNMCSKSGQSVCKSQK